MSSTSDHDGDEHASPGGQRRDGPAASAGRAPKVHVNQQSIHFAVESGDVSRIKAIVEASSGHSLNCCWSGDTPLTNVAGAGPRFNPMIAYICSLPEAWINRKDFSCKATALHLAASSGNAEAVRILLAAGADATIKGFTRNITAAEAAEEDGHSEIASWLRAHVACLAAPRRTSWKDRQ